MNSFHQDSHFKVDSHFLLEVEKNNSLGNDLPQILESQHHFSFSFNKEDSGYSPDDSQTQEKKEKTIYQYKPI